MPGIANFSSAASCVSDDDHVNPNDRGLLAFNLDMGLSLASAIMLGFVALLIFTDKRLQAHPNMLIAYTCLADSFSFFNFFCRYLTCGYHLNEYLDYLFAYTAQLPYMFLFCTPRFTSSCNDVNFIEEYNNDGYFEKTVKIRVRYWYLISEFVLYLSLLLNLCTVLDLYLMLFNPFKNTAKRPKNLVMCYF